MRRTGGPLLLALAVAWQAAWAQSAGQQIIEALERYRLAVLAADIQGQVSSFTEDAQVSVGSEPVLQGRTTIRALLQAQRSSTVVAYELRAAATRVLGSVAVQNGFYSQRILSAQREPRLVKGVFEVRWTRQQDGSWLINHLHTDEVE